MIIKAILRTPYFASGLVAFMPFIERIAFTAFALFIVLASAAFILFEACCVPEILLFIMLTNASFAVAPADFTASFATLASILLNARLI